MALGDEKNKQQVMATEYGREPKEALDDKAWERKAVARRGRGPKALSRADADGLWWPPDCFPEGL